MNDLQLALIAVGGVAITLLVAYNLWQDQRARKNIDGRFEKPSEDPLMPRKAEPIEPTFGGSFSPAYDTHMAPGLSQNTAGAANENAAEVFDHLHAVAYITLETPVQTDSVMAHLQSMRRSGDKQICVAALYSSDQDADGAEVWRSFKAGTEVTHIRSTLQLVNRKGAVNAIDFSDWMSKVQQLADLVNGELEVPDMTDVLKKAEALDHEAAQLDTQLDIHCVLPESVSAATLEGELKKDGWQAHGRQWWFSKDGRPLANAVIVEAPGKRVLSFTLDLPNAHDPIRAFDAIASLGFDLQQTHQGTLTDDTGRALGAQALTQIREQLDERIAALTKAGYTPGSPQAAVVFS